MRMAWCTERKAILLIHLFYLCIYFSIFETNANGISLRLPNSTLPIRYDLHIETNIHKEILDYRGSVIIDVLIRTETNSVVLHAKDLTDFLVKITNLVNGNEIREVYSIYDNRTNFLTIEAKNQTFNVDHQYRLHITFNGIIQSRAFGFYWTTYTDEKDNIVYLAATQFEPTSARSAFPCFDEPRFKSKFIVRITHGSNYSALSNMPIDGLPVVNSFNNMTTTTFMETPLMSTYLIAFVVSNYEHITEEFNGILQSVYTPPQSKDKGQKSLKNAIKSLSLLEDYFKVKYPLPKLDHITLKKSFGSAMENWGLITYNTNKFLQNTENDEHRILTDVLTQNHEIAHQWFGNLVSPEWWTYAWLNEGFATYFSYIGTDLVFPELHVMDFFIDNVAALAFSWPISRPLSHYVESEQEILSVFDVVSYQRAACIIKMFHHAFSRKTFLRGIEIFLNAFQYSAVNEGNLFDSIQRAVDEDDNNINDQQLNGNKTIQNIMYSWTHNEGTPILSVLRNYEDNSITLRQRSSIKNSNELWWIPINFATSFNPDFGNTKADYIMPPEREVILYPQMMNLTIFNDDWLIVNKQQTGFYHVAYDDINMQAIANVFNSNHNEIHYLNRALIFRDIQSVLEKSEMEAMDGVLDLLKYLRKEEDLLTWNSAADTILMMTSNLFGTETYDIYKDFIRTLISPIFQRIYKLSKNNLTVTEQSARQKIISAACKVDLIECLHYAKEMANNYIFNKIQIDDSLVRDAVLCHGTKHSSILEFESILEKLTTLEVNSEFYDDIIYSLRCSENLESLMMFLNQLLGMNSTHTLMTDVESVQYIYFLYSSNVMARPIVLKFIEDNYKLLWKLESFTFLLTRIAGYVPEPDTQKFLDFLDRIEMEHAMYQPEKKYRISVDRKKIGLKTKKKEIFLRNFRDPIAKWLIKHEQAAGVVSRTAAEKSESVTTSKTNY